MVALKATSNRFFLHLRNILTALHLVQTEESRQRKNLTSSASTESIDHPHQQQQPQDHRAYELQHQIVVQNNGVEIVIEDEPAPSDSQWLISIKEKLKQANQDNIACSWRKISIYRIPHYLKYGENEAYVPQIVSIGPYHHGKKHLRQMEQHKWRCLHCMLRRAKHKIVLYLDSVKEVEEKARAFYEGTTSMSSNKFVEMMVLDGCFMIELFQGANSGFKELGYPYDDPIFSVPGMMLSIQWDMIKLENQIPFFILERLFCLQCGQQHQEGLLAKLALLFLAPLKPTDSPPSNLICNSMDVVPLSDHAGLHCLEVFRRGLLGSGPKLEPRVLTPWSPKWQQFIHCVTELRDAGVRFSERDMDSFWDIQFNSGTLEIPRLVIHDGTKSLFLNLIAFEQCHFCMNENHITSYVIFMDNLINSSEDVWILRDNGIIEHGLGSDAEVADLFNEVCQEMVFDFNNSYLDALSVDVNGYSSHKWYRWGSFSSTSTLAIPGQSFPSLLLSFCFCLLLCIPSMESMATTYRVLDFSYSAKYLMSTL